VPLFLEKPVAVSMEQNLALEQAFENSRCQVVVSFPMRAAPLGAQTHQYIQEGAIGSPEHVLATNYVPYGTCFFDSPTYRNYQVTQGLFSQKATHDFDCMMYLMGSTVTRVAAIASYGRVFGGDRPAGLRCSQCDETRTCLESPENRRRTGSSEEIGDHLCLFGEDLGSPETGMNEDASSTLVEFASGAHGFYTQVFYTRRDAGARHHVYSGYLGTLQLDWYKNEVRWVRHHAPLTDVSTVAGNSHALGDYALVRNFLGVIGGTETPSSTIWHGIQSIYVCLAAKESARTGQFVTVRQVGGAAGARSGDCG
jgi:predicted dehydrogenase